NELYLVNERQHEAIRGALAAGSPEGARALAREHVLASFRLLETILEQVGRALTDEPPARRRRAAGPSTTRGSTPLLHAASFGRAGSTASGSASAGPTIGSCSWSARRGPAPPS